MFVINGQFTVKTSSRDALVEMAQALVGLSTAEEGCISYGFFEDQSTPGQFLFFEKWRSREAISEHFEKPYFKDFADRFPAMIEGKAAIEIHEISTTESV